MTPASSSRRSADGARARTMDRPTMALARPQRAAGLATCAPLLALATALAVSTAARAADADESAVAAPAPAARLHRPARARDPAAELARRLDLNAKQRSQVTRLLAVR